MQNNCTKDSENRYFSCRKEAAKYNDALSSRAGAAELLNVSESSLRNYELGLAPVPEDVVVRMADLYNAPELERYFCMNDCPIGKHIGAPVSCNVKRLESIACNFLYHSDEIRMGEVREAVLSIARDGKFNPGEREKMQEVVDYLDDLSMDIDDMRLLLQKRDECYGSETETAGNTP